MSLFSCSALQAEGEFTLTPQWRTAFGNLSISKKVEGDLPTSSTSWNYRVFVFVNGGSQSAPISGSSFISKSGTESNSEYYLATVSSSMTEINEAISNSETLPISLPSATAVVKVCLTTSTNYISLHEIASYEVAFPGADYDANVSSSNGSASQYYNVARLDISLSHDGTDYQLDADLSTDYPSGPATIELEFDTQGLLVHWPMSQDKVLTNGLVIPGYDGTGSPWVYIPLGVTVPEKDTWFAANFDKGQVVTDAFNNEMMIAYFGTDGSVVSERQVDAGVETTVNQNTGNTHLSLGIDGFLNSVVLPQGYNDIPKQYSTDAQNQIAQANSDPNTNITTTPTTGGTVGGSLPPGVTPWNGTSSGSLSGGSLSGSIPLPSGGSSSSVAPPSGATQQSVEIRTINEITNNYYLDADNREASQEFADAAGYSFGEDDGSDTAVALAESLAGTTEATATASAGWLSFLSIPELDPGVDPITLDFDFPETDVSLNWSMPADMASVLRMLILYILYSAFFAGVTRKLMM